MGLRWILILFLLNIGCQSQQEKARQQSWHGSMQGLAESLNAVMPELIANPIEASQRKKQNLEKAIADLKKYSENLASVEMGVPSQDPSLFYVTKDFQSAIQTLSKKVDQQSLEKSSADLRNLSRYCVACHTRTESGSSFYSGQFGDQMSTLIHYDQAIFNAAVRQFERALVNFEKAIADENWRQRHPEKWQSSVMNLLAITIRVKNNANLALEMLSQMKDRRSYPESMQKVAEKWRQDAKSWGNEPKADMSLSKVVKLLEKAGEQDRQLAHSGLLNNLRASRMLNEFLQGGTKDKKQKQAVLFYSGVISERLKNLNFADFPKSYFRACMDLGADTAIGRKCQKKAS